MTTKTTGHTDTGFMSTRKEIGVSLVDNFHRQYHTHRKNGLLVLSCLVECIYLSYLLSATLCLQHSQLRVSCLSRLFAFILTTCLSLSLQPGRRVLTNPRAVNSAAERRKEKRCVEHASSQCSRFCLSFCLTL